MHCHGNRPCIAGSPSFSLGYNIADVWAFENAVVLPLDPMSKPCQRLDVKAFPRPGEAMLSHHCDLYVRRVGEPLVSRKGMWQMERHVLPVTPQIDRHLNAIE